MMASPELDWAASQSYELDSTDDTSSHDDESTDDTSSHEDESTDDTSSHEDESTDDTSSHEDESTDDTSSDEEKGIRMGADSTDSTSGDERLPKNIESNRPASKVPASQTVVRDIAVNAASFAPLPAESNAAFSQWLAGSQLSLRN